MRWYSKQLFGASTLALMLGGCGVVGGHESDARPDREAGGMPITDEVVYKDEVANIGEPYTISGQRYEPRDDNMFDEVGYGMVKGDDLAGTPTSMGESYNPQAMTAAHRILPVPSYVEVTHLDTGKTIVVRINDRGPMSKDRIISLSSAAAHALGMDASGTAPLRVRRVNPPSQEKAMLRNGAMAPERLDTPPSLLSALKRRLSETTPNKPVDLAHSPSPEPRKALPVAKPAPAAPKASVGRPGADFDGASAPAPVAHPVRRPAPVVVPPKPKPTPPVHVRPTGDRFVIEEANGQTPAVTKAAPVRVAKSESAVFPRTEPQISTPVQYFVQIASFSDAGRARALAARAGGSVQSVSGVYRVRTGPYANESSARAALSQLVSKGYRDARIAK